MGPTSSSQCVSVLVDSKERLGELSYLVPEQMVICAGDAVEVPFGTRVARGIVLGSGDEVMATREVLRVFGRRSSGLDIEVARQIASQNLCEFTSLVKRLAPSTKRGQSPLDSGEVVLTDGQGFKDIGREDDLDETPRRLEAVVPSVDMVRLAALEAQRLAHVGQVLVLCATKEMVSKVLAQFEGGAARLDRVPTASEASAWAGMLAGTVRIGIGTRAAALWSAKDLAGIIVVDEDHPGHREVAMPYTHARDVAAARTRASHAALVLLSRNPSPAALGADVKLVVVGTTWPRTSLVARSARRRFEPEKAKGIGALIDATRARGGSVLVVASSEYSVRRCQGCKTTWSCEACHSGACAHCHEVCSSCASEDTLVLGWDVYKTSRVYEVDAVSPAKMYVAKSADLVVLADVDPWLSMAELVPGRVAANRILEAARLVRGHGQLVMVSCETEDELLQLLVKGDMRGVARRTWNAAKEGALPPFGRQVTLSGNGKVPSTSGWPGRVLGPLLKEGGEWEIVVLCKQRDLTHLTPVLGKLRRRGTVKVTVL